MYPLALRLSSYQKLNWGRAPKYAVASVVGMPLSIFDYRDIVLSLELPSWMVVDNHCSSLHKQMLQIVSKQENKNVPFQADCCSRLSVVPTSYHSLWAPKLRSQEAERKCGMAHESALFRRLDLMPHCCKFKDRLLMCSAPEKSNRPELERRMPNDSKIQCLLMAFT